MVPPEHRRKNATREVTAPLKHWLNEHRKNPYPTKAEKTMLAVITRMTMTQASQNIEAANNHAKNHDFPQTIPPPLHSHPISLICPPIWEGKYCTEHINTNIGGG
jgi:hypothetical protein